jgi:hypothetical protein
MESIVGTTTTPPRTADQFRDSTWLVTTMVSVLRQHFGNTERMNLQSSTYTWDRDSSQTKLVIDNADNLNFNDGEIFPKLIVDLENQGFPKDYVGDLDNYNNITAERNYTVRTESAFAIESWGLHKLEVLALCDEARFFLQTFRHEISCKYGFHYLRPVQVVKPTQSKIHTQYWVARLIMGFEITDTWAVQEAELRAAAIRLKLVVG